MLNTNFLNMQDILYVCVKFIANNNQWVGVNFNYNSFNFNSKSINFNNNVLVNLNASRTFLDPFVAYKTLVIMADNKNTIYINANNLLSHNVFTFEFSVKNTNYNNLLSTCGVDLNHNLQAELVQALTSIGVNVVSFYTHATPAESVNTINIAVSQNNVQNIDNIVKTRYAIAWVCNLYKVDIQKANQIFTCSLLQSN